MNQEELKKKEKKFQRQELTVVWGIEMRIIYRHEKTKAERGEREQSIVNHRQTRKPSMKDAIREERNQPKI